MLESGLVWPYALVLGLLVGSYLNVVVYRVPLRQSTVRPPSSCPTCGVRIRARDNVPVLSWLLLRGRCRDCDAAIAIRYPLVEASTGGLFVFCALAFGASVDAGIAALFCSLLLALALIDHDHMILPDRITYPGIAAGLLLQPVWSRTTWTSAIVGALVGAAAIFGLNAIWWVLRRVQGFGLGDAKMLAMIGAFLGPSGAVVTLLLGAFLGSLVGIALMVRGRSELDTKLPFGTFLAIGALVALFFGPRLVDAYLGYYP